MSSTGDEFYVGYLHDAPTGVARRIRRTAAVLVLLALAAAAWLTMNQQAPGETEWREANDPQLPHQGLLLVDPYPRLLNTTSTPGFPRVSLVVAARKFGAGEVLRAFHGKFVELHASPIHRDGREILELVGRPEAVRESPRVSRMDGDELRSSPEDLGPVTVRGEVIDPKCYLGAMKPGSGKTHRACAVRCISGGIPPMLVMEGDGPGSEPARGNRATYYLLTDHEGRAVNQSILPYVGDVVEIRGSLIRDADLLVLRIEPEGIRRL